MTSCSTRETMWIIGGGSGIGRATARMLAGPRRDIIISGRRTDRLDAAAEDIRADGYQASALPLDATDRAGTDAVYEIIRDRFPPVSTVVFATGKNLREQRWWQSMTPQDFASVIDTNLTAAVNVIASVLPDMRHAGGGRIVIVGSWAGWRYMSVAGAAYSASKMGLGAIVDSLNDQEGRAGIAATLVVPAEVRTEIMKSRPTSLSPDELAAMLDPSVVGLVIKSIVDLPRHVCINEIVISSIHNGIYLRDSAFRGPITTAMGPGHRADLNKKE